MGAYVDEMVGTNNSWTNNCSTSPFSIEKMLLLSVAASARKCHARTLPFATVPDVTGAVIEPKAQGTATPLHPLVSHLAVSQVYCLS